MQHMISSISTKSSLSEISRYFLRNFFSRDVMINVVPQKPKVGQVALNKSFFYHCLKGNHYSEIFFNYSCIYFMLYD